MKILICHNGMRIRIEYIERLLQGRGYSISMIDLSSGSFLLQFAKVKYLMFKHDLLIIYPSTIKAFFPLLVCKMLGKPSIFEFSYSSIQARIFESDWKPNGIRVRLGRFIEKAACNNSNHIIVHSNSELDWIAKEYHLERKKLSALPHFPDPLFYHPQEKDERLLKSLHLKNKFIIEYNGRFLEMHGVEYVVSCIPYVVKRFPRAVFLFVNVEKEEGCMQKYKKQVEELGVGEHAVFISEPSLGDHPTYLSLADIFLSAFSGKEKVQRTIRATMLEAMAMGKPVISAKTQETTKSLKERKNILFSLPEDPKDLARKITILIENDRLRETLGKGGLAFSKQNKFEETFLGIVHNVVNI